MTGLAWPRVALALLLVLAWLVFTVLSLRAYRRREARGAPATAGDADLWIAYASQTGFAERLAEQTARGVHRRRHRDAIGVPECDERRHARARRSRVVPGQHHRRRRSAGQRDRFRTPRAGPPGRPGVAAVRPAGAGRQRLCRLLRLRSPPRCVAEASKARRRCSIPWKWTMATPARCGIGSTTSVAWPDAATCPTGHRRVMAAGRSARAGT